MAEIHGRESSLHNGIAGATLGYIGVSAGRLSVPFVSPTTFYQNPRLNPGIVGGAVYGGLAMAMATFLGGKPL